MKREDDGPLLFVGALGVIGFVLTLTLLTNCAGMQVIATDAKACASSQISAAVASASTEFLTSAALSDGTQSSYLQIGATLALKYGTDVAWCTITKAWADLGGPAFLKSHLQPTRELIAADYLKSHPEKWLLPPR